jgi:hypothetical protein
MQGGHKTEIKEEIRFKQPGIGWEAGRTPTDAKAATLGRGARAFHAEPQSRLKSGRRDSYTNG